MRIPLPCEFSSSPSSRTVHHLTQAKDSGSRLFFPLSLSPHRLTQFWFRASPGNLIQGFPVSDLCSHATSSKRPSWRLQPGSLFCLWFSSYMCLLNSVFIYVLFVSLVVSLLAATRTVCLVCGEQCWKCTRCSVCIFWMNEWPSWSPRLILLITPFY